MGLGSNLKPPSDTKKNRARRAHQSVTEAIRVALDTLEERHRNCVHATRTPEPQASPAEPSSNSQGGDPWAPAVPTQFYLFTSEPLLHHLLSASVDIAHAIVSIIDQGKYAPMEQEVGGRSNTGTSKADATMPTIAIASEPRAPRVPYHEPLSQATLDAHERLTHLLWEHSERQMLRLAKAYSKVLLSCSQFESALTDQAFFECLYAFILEIVWLHVKWPVVWPTIRRQLSLLFLGPTRLSTQVRRHLATEQQAAHRRHASDRAREGQVQGPERPGDVSSIPAPKGRVKFGGEEEQRTGEDPVTDSLQPVEASVQRSRMERLSAGFASRGKTAAQVQAEKRFKASVLPSMKDYVEQAPAGKPGGGYLLRDPECAERYQAARFDARRRDKVEEMKQRRARQAARERAATRQGPRGWANTMIKAEHRIRDSQKLVESILERRASTAASEPLASPRIEVVAGTPQAAVSPLVSALSNRPSIPINTKPTPTAPGTPRRSGVPPRKHAKIVRASEATERPNVRGGLLANDDDVSQLGSVGVSVASPAL